MSTDRAGLGCMGMSGVYGPAAEDDSIATIQAAVEADITLIDTGDFYGMGHNEMLIGRALADTPRDAYRLSVKFGAQRGPDGAWLGYDASPAAVKTAAAYSLQRLRTDHIDIYRPARLDRKVPIEETVGAIGELVKAGYVREVGLSEVGAETIRRAAATHPIADLQIEYSLISREIEREILPTCRELGIAVTAYGILSRGLLSDSFDPTRSGRRATCADGSRASTPTTRPTTSSSFDAFGRLQPSAASPSRRSQSRGSPRAATMSSRLSALDASTSSSRRLGVWSSSSTPRSCPSSSTRPVRQPDRATARRRWPISTASAELGGLEPNTPDGRLTFQDPRSARIGRRGLPRS